MVRIGFPEEYPITLVINGHELATFQLTKSDLEDWTVGYLYTEGIIQGAEDIDSFRLNEDQGKIFVDIKGEVDVDAVLTKQKHFTAGCGKGVTFFSMTDVKSFPK